MNSELIDQLSTQLGANGLPYTIPLHPNLVHLTLGLFIIGILFDIVGVFLPCLAMTFRSVGFYAVQHNCFG